MILDRSARPDGRANDRERRIDVLFDERRRDAKNANAIESDELLRAMLVELVRASGVVKAAIDLDDETVRGHVEVDDVRIEDVLPANANTELTLTNPPPEQRFRASRRFAMLTSKLSNREERRGVVFVHES
jgi:hypothetical protein